MLTPSRETNSKMLIGWTSIIIDTLALPFPEDRPYEEWEVAADQSGGVSRN